MFDLKGVLDPIVAIINKVVPDKTAQLAAQAQLQALVMQGQIQEELIQLQAVTSAQSDVDKVEAGSASMFVAGGRPFVIWVCAVGLAYVSIIEPVARFIAQVGFKYAGAFPAIDTTMTSQVLFGLLGLGTMRTFEKIKGVTK